MRILLVTTSYPLFPGSIAGIFVERLARALSGHCQVDVLTPAGTEAEAAGSDLRPRVHAFRYAPRRWRVLAQRAGGIPVALRAQRLCWLLVPGFLAGLFLHCLLLARGRQVIQANWAICGLVAGLAGRLLGKPVLLTLRGEDVNRIEKPGVHLWILRAALALADRVVAVGEDVRSAVAGAFPHRQARMRVIVNGVDEALLGIERGELRNDGCLNLIGIGSLIPRKGFDVTLRAVAALPPALRERVRIRIAGAGPERQRLEAQARELGIAERLECVGVLNGEALIAFYRDADLFVLSSHSEGRANVLVEAMAAALPVLAADISGARELLVDDRSALLFRAGDDAALAQALARVLGLPQLRARLAENARLAIEELGLTWERTAAQYLELANESLAERA